MTQFHGPFDPEISPDGSKIAFEYFNDTYDAAPGCNELTVPPCYAYTQSQGVGITNATGFTGVDAYGLLTGWVAPHWVSNETLLRSSPGANLNDDAVFTQVGATTNDPWFYDPNQGLGVEDVELSRDLQTVVGIAGFNSEKLRVYRTTMSPFGAPDWDHTPFTNHENVPVAQQCYELPGTKFENTTLAPSGAAMAYSTAAGVFVASIPAGCAPGGRRRARPPRRQAPRLGRRRRPARVRVRDARAGAASGAAGRHEQARPVGDARGQGHRDRSRRRQGHRDGQAQVPHGGQGLKDREGRRQGHVQAQAARQGDRHGEAGRVDREADAHNACMTLDSTVALVTGASSGIGEATARALAAQGAKVALAARRKDRLDALAGEIGGLAIEADITDREQAIAAVEQTVSELGRLDIVVNNAGVMLLGDIVDAPVEEWERMIDLNVKGLLYVAHAALPHLLKFAQEGPREVADLVNISSVAGRRVGQGGGIYQLTKHGVGVFSRGAAPGGHGPPRALLAGRAGRDRVRAGRRTCARRCAATSTRARTRSSRRPTSPTPCVYIVTRPRHMAVNEILDPPDGASPLTASAWLA